MNCRVVINNITKNGTLNQLSISGVTQSRYATKTGRNLLDNNFSGSKPTIVGSSIVGTTYLLDSYNGFMSKEFDTPATISMLVSNAPSIKVYFDSVSMDYPTDYTIIYNDSKITEKYTNNTNPIITIRNPNNDSNIQLILTKYNKTNSPVRVTRVSLSQNIDFDNNTGLLSFVSGNQMTDDNNTPNYGLTGNYGNIEVYDRDNDIEFCAMMGYLNDPKEVDIYIDNVKTGNFISSSFEKNGLNVTIQLKDKLLGMQDINVPKKFFGTTSLSEVMLHLINICKNNNYELENENVVLSYCDGYNTPNNFFMSSGTLWDKLTEVCQVVGLYAYMNRSGKVEFIKNE